MEVTWGERGFVICPSPELAGFIGVREKLCVPLRITESLAELCVIVQDEVFRVLVWVGGGREVLRPFLFLSL